MKKDPVVGSFLKIAGSNLRSSIILYDRRQYLESIFLLQQAIEKSIKAVSIYAGFFTLESVQSVKHHSGKLLKEVFRQHAVELKSVDETQQQSPSFFQFMKQCGVDFTGYEKQIAGISTQITLIEEKTDISVIGFKGLKEIIDDINLAAKDVEILIKSPSFRKFIRNQGLPFTEKILNSDFFRENLDPSGTPSQADIEAIQLIIEVVIIRSIPSTASVISLIFQGFIFSRLVSRVRYPSLIDGKFCDPTKEFNGKHPLVRLLPEFHRLVKKDIRKLKGILTPHKRLNP